MKNRVFWDVVLGLVFVLSLGYLLFFSRAFEITKVGIAAPEGLGHLVLEAQSAVMKELNKPFLAVLKRHTFFSVNAAAIKKNILASYPDIETMRMRRIFPHDLFLELYERKEVAVWCNNETDCFFIDKKGVIFKGASTTSLNELALIVSKKEHPNNLLEEVISEEKLAQILEIQENLSDNLKISLFHFLTDSEEMLHVVTDQGWKVYFVLGGDVSGALTKLKLLFEKEIPEDKRKNLEYIDLRFTKAYYKWLPTTNY